MPISVAAFTVRVEFPLPPVTVVGERLQVVEPRVVVTVHVSATSEVKPAVGVTLMVAVPLCALFSVSELTEAVTAKSGLVPLTVTPMGTG